MQRITLASLVLAVLVLLSRDDSANAAMISRSNPYRSFNISGVNYASTQWERQRSHSQTRKGSMGWHSNGRWFGRR